MVHMMLQMLHESLINAQGEPYVHLETDINWFHATGLFLQKIYCFQMFSGGIKRGRWHEVG